MALEAVHSTAPRGTNYIDQFLRTVYLLLVFMFQNNKDVLNMPLCFININSKTQRLSNKCLQIFNFMGCC